MNTDLRVQSAREYLVAVGRHKPDQLPPSVMIREIYELRRQLGQVLDTIGQAPRGVEAARLAQIRQLLADFDWEFHDRQLALEAIERIADGTEAVPAETGPAGLPPAQLSTVLAALDDAATFRTERAAAYCYDCSSHPAGACDVHVDDLDQADAYRQVTTELQGGK